MQKKFDEKEAMKMIEEGVKNVYQSDNFKEYLKFLSKFHNYSLNNTILILSQCPNASLVAGYNKWQNDFKRYVNKGEKAIKILAPYEIKQKYLLPIYDEYGVLKLDGNGNTMYEEKEIKKTKFRVVNVFDISQTDGKPLPELIHDLKGSNDNIKIFIESLKEVCTIPILFKDKNSDDVLLEGARGYYDKLNDIIVVNGELEDLQIAKTLAHEYAHSILHKNTEKTQSQREIEAESLAFIICNHFGIDTSEYSFNYIATYSNQDFDFLKSVLQDIQTYAHTLIQLIEPVYERKGKEMVNDLSYINPLDMEKMSMDLVEELSSKISGTPIELYLKDIDVNEDFAKDELNTELNEIMEKLKDQFPVQYELYKENDYYKDALQESIFLRFYYHTFIKEQDRPFIENSIERQNYLLLEKIAKPILDETAYYMKLEQSLLMDFNIERVGENRIAMSHYFKLNGDLMADPDIVVLVDKKNKLIIPDSYQQDNMQLYIDVEKHPEFISSLNLFISDWIKNIQNNHYKLKSIITDERSYEVGIDDNKDIVSFCKKNKIKHLLPKHLIKEEKER